MQDNHGFNLARGDHLGSGNQVEHDVKQMEKGDATGNILVVDDSATVREVECHMLEQADYSATTAVNGVDGFN